MTAGMEKKIWKGIFPSEESLSEVVKELSESRVLCGRLKKLLFPLAAQKLMGHKTRGLKRLEAGHY